MTKNLEDIWYELRPGNIVAYQTRNGWDGSRHSEVDKIRIGTVVAIDIFDMALAVGVVDLCKFDCYGIAEFCDIHPDSELTYEDPLGDEFDYTGKLSRYEVKPFLTQVGSIYKRTT